MEDMVFKLWGSEIGFILEGEGVTYSNQVGGYSCEDVYAKGCFVPMMSISNSAGIMEDKFQLYFLSDKYNGWCCAGIDDADADYLEGFFPPELRVNREKLGKSMEAWVHCLYKGQPAILTWENSD
jgi:hypothetical protein